MCKLGENEVNFFFCCPVCDDVLNVLFAMSVNMLVSAVKLDILHWVLGDDSLLEWPFKELQFLALPQWHMMGVRTLGVSQPHFGTVVKHVKCE